MMSSLFSPMTPEEETLFVEELEEYSSGHLAYLDVTAKMDTFPGLAVADLLSRFAVSQEYCLQKVEVDCHEGVTEVWGHIVLKHTGPRDFFTTPSFPAEWYT